MPKLKLTAMAVARLTPPEAGRMDYFDTTMPAFGLRISHTGARKFFVMTRINGQLARLTLGQAKLEEDAPGLTLAEARRKAGEWVELAQAGHDPRQQRQAEKAANTAKAANTFRVVADRFMAQHVEPRLAAKTKVEYRRVLQGPDTREWENRPISTITSADVRAVLDVVIQRGSLTAANNTLSYLSKFFNWCAEKELIDRTPTERIKKPSPVVIGDRTLSEVEIKEVWEAFGVEGDSFSDLFKLLLLTGQRRGEVAGMSRTELSKLDSENAVWEIPKERTKNSRPHLVPLSSMVLRIIAGRPDLGDDGLLFTSTGKTPVSGFSKAKERVDDYITQARAKAGLPPMSDWTLHDLRRTMVTMMNEHLRIPPHVVEACVNHISGSAKAGVAGVYNKALYLDERRAAFEAWGNFVQSLVEPEQVESNVVPLRG